MSPVLADFSVESENTIILSFFDGTRLRVRPADLHRYLDKDDLRKVKRALSMRKDFIKKVLPPGAMVFLLGATIVLAVYDVQRIAQILKENPRPAVTEITTQQKEQGVLSGKAIETYMVAPEPSVPLIAPLVPASPPALRNLEPPGPPGSKLQKQKNGSNQVNDSVRLRHFGDE